jgi:hypothetical protein
MGTSSRAFRYRAGEIRRTLLLLLALAGAGASGANATASPSPSGPAAVVAAASAPHAVIGMNGWTVFKMAPPQRDQQLAAMAAAGVKVVRSDAPWADIEPAPPGPTGHAFNFTGFDSWVTTLANHHLTWQPLIDFSVWWAKTCPGFCAPKSDSTYAAFAQAVAARYGAGGTFWKQNPKLPYYPAQIFEIWDEENNQTYYVAPARFATLYTAARTAIRAADPSASVIVGGLADDSQSYDPSKDYPAQYVYRMFAAQPSLRGNVDGFGLHPYGTTAADAIKWTVDFRRVLNSLGEASAPIDITEFGWTGGDPGREVWRAWMMNTVGQQLSRSDCGIRLLEPYDWINPGDSSGDFGLVDLSTLSTTLRLAGSTWFKALAIAAPEPTLGRCGPHPKIQRGPAPRHKPKPKKHTHKPKPKRHRPAHKLA